MQYEYDLESSLGMVAERVDFIVVMLDPKALRLNMRELQLYEDLYSKCLLLPASTFDSTK